jgi:hypothetical protein
MYCGHITGGLNHEPAVNLIITAGSWLEPVVKLVITGGSKTGSEPYYHCRFDPYPNHLNVCQSLNR